MRILLVGMSRSIHVARWASAAMTGGLEVGVFPSDDERPHPTLDGITLFKPSGDNRDGVPPGVRVVHAPGAVAGIAPQLGRAVSLAAVIRRFRPDLVHAQEIQHGGYLTTRAIKMLRRPPPVLLTIWGSDISLRARIPTELPRIAETLRHVDALIAECTRDLDHARRLGYDGDIALAVPAAGGFDLDHAAALRQPGPTSARRTVAVKGYQHFAGRAQVALRAIELCGQRLSGFRLAIYGVQPTEQILASRIATNAEMQLEVVSTPSAPASHDAMLGLHGRARISVGQSIADGISTSLLEAMVMGSFPIQSGTACADEWIVDGATGFIVPAEDPSATAQALLAAAEDDELVDRAAAANWETARARLDFRALQRQILDVYERVAPRVGASR